MRYFTYETTSAFKMLDIFLYENLSFNYYYKQVRNKVSKALYFWIFWIWTRVSAKASSAE